MRLTVLRIRSTFYTMSEPKILVGSRTSIFRSNVFGQNSEPRIFLRDAGDTHCEEYDVERQPGTYNTILCVTRTTAIITSLFGNGRQQLNNVIFRATEHSSSYNGSVV